MYDCILVVALSVLACIAGWRSGMARWDGFALFLALGILSIVIRQRAGFSVSVLGLACAYLGFAGWSRERVRRSRKSESSQYQHPLKRVGG